jgi:hypothetical protein
MCEDDGSDARNEAERVPTRRGRTDSERGVHHDEETAEKTDPTEDDAHQSECKGNRRSTRRQRRKASNEEALGSRCLLYFNVLGRDSFFFENMGGVSRFSPGATGGQTHWLDGSTRRFKRTVRLPLFCDRKSDMIHFNKKLSVCRG